ncbi:hypothetical protein A9Q77_05565 [Marinomonas sp. 42_23_T18]|nr:hypothetical protein A9Q77_05565 [Marinomonas sp. 42_23_T18]
MICVYQFTLEQDPAALSKTLWQQKIPHRIIQREGVDQLWLLDERHIPMTQQILNMYLGEPDKLAQIPINPISTKAFNLVKFTQLISLYPVNTGLVLMSILVAILTGLGSQYSQLSWFSFLPIQVSGNYITTTHFNYVLEHHQYWRLITPIFIHFSMIHIAFNLLWMWDIGRKVEKVIGSYFYLLLVLLTALLSNYLQYLSTESPLFGGMSGVVYAIIGFAWLVPKLIPHCPSLISKPIMIFLILWLALGYSNVFEQIGMGKMANTAHLIGLVCGLVCAYLYHLYAKRQRR